MARRMCWWWTGPARPGHCLLLHLTQPPADRGSVSFVGHPRPRMTGHDLLCSLHWCASPRISRSAGSITTSPSGSATPRLGTEEVEAVQVRPRRQDAPAQGRPAPHVPDAGPVANSPTEVLSVLSGTRCPG